MAQSWEINFCVLLKDEDFKNAQNIHFEAGLIGSTDLQNFSTMQHFHKFIPRTYHFLQIVQKWKWIEQVQIPLSRASSNFPNGETRNEISLIIGNWR